MMKVSEALRVSYKNQFGIVNENYESSVLLDSLVMTTEEINETLSSKKKIIRRRIVKIQKSIQRSIIIVRIKKQE